MHTCKTGPQHTRDVFIGLVLQVSSVVARVLRIPQVAAFLDQPDHFSLVGLRKRHGWDGRRHREEGEKTALTAPTALLRSTKQEKEAWANAISIGLQFESLQPA